MELIQFEIWRDIPGWEGLYQVSTMGCIKSIRHTYRHGFVKRDLILKQECYGGYFTVVLCENGNKKRFYVHRLVAQTFIANPYNLPCVNHKDENPLNNCVENLEWCTQKYNCNYGTRLDKIRGKQTFFGKCKQVEQYSIDGVLLHTYSSAMQIQRLLGYDNSCVHRCCKGIIKTAYGFKWKYK